MRIYSYKYQILALSIVILSSFIIQNVNGHFDVVYGQNQDSENETRVVLFHQGRNQFFNSTIMNGALNLLEEKGFTITFSTETINKTVLAGIDVLIIPGSPVAPTEDVRDYRYSETEVNAIEDWLLQPNHGIILLSNPYTSNSTLNIDSSNLNIIVTGINTVFPANRFFAGSDGQGLTINTLSKGEYNDSSILSIELTNNTEFTFSSNTTIVTKSNHVQVLNYMARAKFNAFAKDSEGTIDLINDYPVILGGSTSGRTSSKLFLIGSALMFSDLPGPTGTEDNPISWFDTANNADIWLKLVLWTISVTVDEEPVDFISILAIFLPMQVISGISLVVLGFFVFLRNSRSFPSPSQSVSIDHSRKASETSTSEDATSQKQIKGKSTQIKSSRRRKKR